MDTPRLYTFCQSFGSGAFWSAPASYGCICPSADRKKWGFRKLGYHFGGPHNKDYSILGSILGSPHLWKLPNPYADIDAQALVCLPAVSIVMFHQGHKALALRDTSSDCPCVSDRVRLCLAVRVLSHEAKIKTPRTFGISATLDMNVYTYLHLCYEISG